MNWQVLTQLAGGRLVGYVQVYKAKEFNQGLPGTNPNLRSEQEAESGSPYFKSCSQTTHCQTASF